MVTALHKTEPNPCGPSKPSLMALKVMRADPEGLVAGLRNDRSILTDQTGSVDFDLGDSPREFTPAAVAGGRIALTTTYGTTALPINPLTS